MFSFVRRISMSPAVVGGAALAMSMTSSFAHNKSSCASSSGLNIADIKKDISNAIDSDEERRNDGTSIAPTFIRLAWHASGTYSKVDKTGGSNGATMRFAGEKDWGANAGLAVARDALEPIKKKHPAITYADLWTLAGATAVEHMGGPVVRWRPGRSDATAPTKVPDGRLPNADMGESKKTISHIRDVFYRMGFNDREIVALIGAHAVGRMHKNASGFDGPWTRAETTFSNEFFKILINEKFAKRDWKGPLQYETSDKIVQMTPADMAFVEDAEFKKVVVEYAKDETLFFKDFAEAFAKLLELGVPR